MAGVLLVLEGVLPAVLSPLVAQEADEGWAPDEVGGGESADQAVEDGEALGRSGPPRRAPVFISARPPEVRPAPVLVRQIGPLVGGEVAPVTHCAQPPAVDDVHAPEHAHAGVGRLAGVGGVKSGGLNARPTPHSGGVTRQGTRVPL